MLYGEDHEGELRLRAGKDSGAMTEACADSGIPKPVIHSHIGDIRDFEELRSFFEKAKPEIVIHLAAQPIVRESYVIPRETYEINVMGTVNLLECIRTIPGCRSVLNVTTDKVYLNEEKKGYGYREEDRLNERA